MFCPLIFEMSEVKIKKVGVASPPQNIYRIYIREEEVKMIVINFAGRKLQHSFLLRKRGFRLFLF